MGRIFISYRRDDSSEFARILYSRLLDEFGTEKIFLDKSSIEGGADFIGMINNSIATADVMLVIIGHAWAGAAGRDDGSRRILSSEDFVRLEVATAFRKLALHEPQEG